MAGSAPPRPDIALHPPLVAAALLVAGWALERLWPAPLAALGLAGGARAALGWALAALGAAVMAEPAGRFVRAGTAIPTYQPARALVTEGLYRFSRNPMYLGLLALWAGIALLFDNGWLLALTAVLAGVLRYGVIAREERYLEAVFGADYRRYRARVRRWL